MVTSYFYKLIFEWIFAKQNKKYKKHLICYFIIIEPFNITYNHIKKPFEENEFHQQSVFLSTFSTPACPTYSYIHTYIHTYITQCCVHKSPGKDTVSPTSGNNPHSCVRCSSTSHTKCTLTTVGENMLSIQIYILYVTPVTFQSSCLRANSSFSPKAGGKVSQGSLCGFSISKGRCLLVTRWMQKAIPNPIKSRAVSWAVVLWRVI